MAEKWKKPDLRRAIQVAHSQGLAVVGMNIGSDGSLSLHTCDQTVIRDDETAPLPTEGAAA